MEASGASPGVYKPLVLAGPSGVGKGTLIALLTTEFPALFGFSVSCTTRKPRPGEVNGTHYHFVTVEEYQFKKENSEFVESNQVHGNFYGTLKEELHRIGAAGKICILDIDVGGAKQIFASGIDTVYVFIMPPSIEELERRLKTRGTEDPATLQTRLRNAEKEIEEGRSLTHMFRDIVVNDQLEASFEELKKVLSTYYPQLRGR